MHRLHYRPLASAITFSLFMLGGCNSSTTSSTILSADTTGTSDTTTTTGGLAFVAGALSKDPVVVDCTLSDGTNTTCYQITSVGAPAKQKVGPFCPKTIYSTAADSGIWFYNNGANNGIADLDGNFIMSLPAIYNDNKWKLYDDVTGKVHVTDTQVACEAAARPDVDPAYQNYCVECSMDYINGGISATYLIPTTPIPADVTGAVSQVGIALNGTELSAPAPVSDILSNYTIAAFDDCGGHVNTHQGYHYHAATGCSEVGTQADGHAALLGYALDGYGIYGMKDAIGNEESLDECRGTTDSIRGYHYHAASPGENMFIGCFHGKTVTAAQAGGPPAGGPPNGIPPTQ